MRLVARLDPGDDIYYSDYCCYYRGMGRLAAKYHKQCRVPRTSHVSGGAEAAGQAGVFVLTFGHPQHRRFAG